MDKDSYPDISIFKVISIQTLDDEQIKIGELTLNNISYFAMHKTKKDILELTSYGRKYLFTPTDKNADKKHLLIVNKDSNMEITLGKYNDILGSRVLEKDDYGIHFK